MPLPTKIIVGMRSACNLLWSFFPYTGKTFILTSIFWGVHRTFIKANWRTRARVSSIFSVGSTAFWYGRFVLQHLILYSIHIKPKLLSCHITLQVPFHLATRLWDTYLAEGDYLPDFLLYIAASFLLTVSYGTLTHNWFLQILFESVSTSTVLRLRNVPKKILLVKYIFYLVTLNLKEVHMF